MGQKCFENGVEAREVEDADVERLDGVQRKLSEKLSQQRKLDLIKHESHLIFFQIPLDVWIVGLVFLRPVLRGHGVVEQVQELERCAVLHQG